MLLSFATIARNAKMKVFASAAILASLAVQAATAGFVKTSGTAFELDGEPFYIFGTNSYWTSEINWSEADLTTIFKTMATNDLTVCRTEGFADLTSVGTAPYNIVYQLWENGTPTINTKENGLGYFDKVVAAAKAAGVKLVVPLVNNWSDYGGMGKFRAIPTLMVPSRCPDHTLMQILATDVYVKQLGGKYHDEFYTNEKVKAAYKNYIATFVKRYKYIKSLDSNHLVATGSEGFMNTNSSVYLYSGVSGVDFDANLAIDSIDYGAYHAYPDGWSVDPSEFVSWGEKWINDHVASGKKAGKPVVMEEYGVKTHNATVYKAWSDAVYAAGSSMQYWELGIESLKTYKGDYTIYDTDDLFESTIVPAAKKFKARS
ncbi:unnamed protein product [Phytophthora lilii]|uniref:mannan endo-1,4-beta-mannosidase n=1 Tax=Phytophthora lilii TaxID=2077276 RepID=A0A9W6X8D0_9STRA|nr:unnamed protein product [Phytophthora lilii]